MVTIELGNDRKNINPLIEPLGVCRRGKWRRSSLPLSDLKDAEVAGLPDVPGIYVSVDPKAKKIRVYDPLDTHPEKKSVLSALQKLHKRPVAPVEESVTEDQSEQTILRWLCAMYRLVDAKMATVVSGEFPKFVAERIRAERMKDAKKAGMELEDEAPVAVA